MKIKRVIFLSICLLTSSIHAHDVDFEKVWTQKSTLNKTDKQKILKQLTILKTNIKNNNIPALKKVLGSQETSKLRSELYPITNMNIQHKKLVIDTYQKDGATAQQKKRKYYAYATNDSSSNGYFYYYLQGNKKIPTDAVCDKKISASWLGEYLLISNQDKPNKLTPEGDESCGVNTDHYFFKLVNGQLKLVDNFSYP